MKKKQVVPSIGSSFLLPPNDTSSSLDGSNYWPSQTDLTGAWRLMETQSYGKCGLIPFTLESLEEMFEITSKSTDFLQLNWRICTPNLCLYLKWNVSIWKVNHFQITIRWRFWRIKRKQTLINQWTNSQGSLTLERRIG